MIAPALHPARRSTSPASGSVPGGKAAGDERPRIAAPARLGEEGGDGGGLDQAHGLDREQFRVARPEADAVETPCRGNGHSAALASALTAAAAIALPPLRPRTTIEGYDEATSASLDSAAPTKPTGMPMIAAGAAAPVATNSSKRKSAVGALPLATTAPPSFGRHRSSAAAERVVASRAASAATS